ncbi:uncharacterized protein C1orf159 homolog isoform X1 [Bufo bufo]|uniref:uncharacterized protein C1orf159 homolog isoform X1 n=1 Tax=Bufo bufo TaxID=8384 RepID=UPI001ABE7358|nr:uncharacterized protein C1orf159 homolog isoform X1 [Bufo bufo]XP_040271488.1 uncharacterized protein C1orf159 homolog isoform X1 [Bufo bufo]XP_040271489.1 uncharacterized protein C1orf159 homolog isoform X1 [Bufo bufo]
MAVACLLLLGRFIMDSVGESVNFLVSDCCSETPVLNGSCPVDQRCSPGCYQVWTNDTSLSCIKCDNETSLEVSQNVTACRGVTTQASEIHMNLSTTPSVPHHLSNPGVAASLLLGTLFISLFLVLSVASFFYLKRSHMLPEIFYRRNKASILQPSEMASMIPEPNPSGRKPRYVRRERTRKAAVPLSLDPSADTQVSIV